MVRLACGGKPFLREIRCLERTESQVSCSDIVLARGYIVSFLRFRDEFRGNGVARLKVQLTSEIPKFFSASPRFRGKSILFK